MKVMTLMLKVSFCNIQRLLDCVGYHIIWIKAQVNVQGADISISGLGLVLVFHQFMRRDSVGIKFHERFGKLMPRSNHLAFEIARHAYYPGLPIV